MIAIDEADIRYMADWYESQVLSWARKDRERAWPQNTSATPGVLHISLTELGSPEREKVELEYGPEIWVNTTFKASREMRLMAKDAMAVEMAMKQECWDRHKYYVGHAMLMGGAYHWPPVGSHNATLVEFKGLRDRLGYHSFKWGEEKTLGNGFIVKPFWQIVTERDGPCRYTTYQAYRPWDGELDECDTGKFTSRFRLAVWEYGWKPTQVKYDKDGRMFDARVM